MPTAPSHQGWAATHSTVSYPSALSHAKVRNSPSDPCRPRTSWHTSANPASAARSGSSAAGGVSDRLRSYGVRQRTAGAGPGIVGEIGVGAQHGAVPHRHGKVGLYPHVALTVRDGSGRLGSRGQHDAHAERHLRPRHRPDA